MSKLNTQIYEEASEWIVLHRSDDLDAEAKRRFDAWVRESPQHLKAYLEMSTIWEDVPTLQHDWNPNANELIARAREDSNVFPLEQVPFLTMPGSGGVGLLGQSPEALSEPERARKALNPLEALKASNEGDAEEVPEQTAAHLELATEPPLQAVPVVTVPASQSTLMKLLAIAATLILTAGVSGWFYLQRDTYSTDIGEQRTLALTDGSSVELNARTKIRIAYTDQARTIELLQGQALFKVAKDPNRPFIVASAATKIRAVGTQFDVYKKSTGTQVTVVEGRVAVLSGLSREVPTAHRGSAEETQGFSGPSRPTNPNETTEPTSASPRASHAGSTLNPIPGELLLSAGEQILIADETPTPSLAVAESNAKTQTSALTTESSAPAIKPANIEAATAWTQQRLVFDFAPLTEVAQEFNRYNHRLMKIDCGTFGTVPTTPNPPTPAPAAAPAGDPCNFNISGSFSSTDPTLLLRFLREQPGIVVMETSDEIRISREDSTSG